MDLSVGPNNQLSSSVTGGSGLPSVWGLNVLKTLVNPKTYQDPASFATSFGAALMPYGWMVGLMPLAVNVVKRLFGGGGGPPDHIGYNLVANPTFKVLGQDDNYIYYTADPATPDIWQDSGYLTEFRINKATGDIEYKRTGGNYAWTRVNQDALPDVIKEVFGGEEITPEALAQLEKEMKNPAEGASYSPELMEAMKDWKSKYLTYGYHELDDTKTSAGLSSYEWVPFGGRTDQGGGTQFVYDPRGYSSALYYDVLSPTGNQSLWEGDPPPENITPDMYEWSGEWYASGAPEAVPEVVPYYLKLDNKGRVKYAYGAVPAGTAGSTYGPAPASQSGGVSAVTATGGQVSMGKNKNVTTTKSQSASMPSWGEQLWDYYMNLLLGNESQPGVYGTAQDAYSQYLQQLSALGPEYEYVAQQMQREIAAMDQPPVAFSIGGQHIGNFVPYAKTTLPYLSGYAGLVKQYEDMLAKKVAAEMAPTLMALSAAQAGFPLVQAGMGTNIQQSTAIPRIEPSTAQQIGGWVNILGGLSRLPGVGDALDDLGSWAWGEVKDAGKDLWNWMTSFFD